MANIDRFKQLISNSKTIVITTHVSPDADGIGSQIALSIALKSLNKNVFCINQEELLPRYQYLDKDKIVVGFDRKKLKIKTIDLFIIVDANSVNRIGPDLKELSQNANELLFIDHHPAPREFLALHYIDVSKAATGEIVAELIQTLGVQFTYQMALALYTSIIIDTNSFQYPTVGSKTHSTVSKLLKTGISPPQAMKEIYGQENISFYHFLGKVLSKTKCSSDNRIVYVTITLKDLEDYQIDPEDTHGIINQILTYRPALVLCMFRELTKNSTKISFRSMGAINVGSMAEALGGGGHSYSAATIIKFPLRKSVDHVLKIVSLILDSDNQIKGS